MPTPKPLDDYELDCMVNFFAEEFTYGAKTQKDDRAWARGRSRVRRFVLTHPIMTPRLKRQFIAAQRRALRENIKAGL